ncbi:MAG: DUF2167 domain-containing protein [Calditrichaceae bacterium]|jgi:uncharacterized membrane-anchored protein
MKSKNCRVIIILGILFLLSVRIPAQEEQQYSVFDQIDWQAGPAMVKLDDLAELNLPEGYLFANGEDTRILMEALGNPPSYTEKGLYGPESLDWFVVFEFDDIGYVNDDEKNDLDADAMLESIREGNEESNKYRRERGFTGLTIIGWETPPHYDAITHNLEWAIKGVDDEGAAILNHNTRILGRSGVMRVTLVVDPASLQAVLPVFKKQMKGFAYQTGQKYTEFREGDKIAEYGLTALVVGGAAAVAAKSGLFKWLWKILVVAGAAIGGYFKKLFGKKSKGE